MALIPSHVKEVGAVTTPRKVQAAGTEQALKDAARRVFARQGYLNTKITDITREAGRAAGSFYNHFSGKEELLESLLTDLFAEGDTAVADEEHNPDFTDRAALRWHVAMGWHFQRRHLPELLALRQAALVSPTFRNRIRELVAADSAHLHSHLEYVRAAGIPLPGKPDLVISAFNTLLTGFAQEWLTDPGAPGAPTDDEAIDLLTDLIYRGIAGRPPV
jgi:AcrR family transcriptional regulator